MKKYRNSAERSVTRMGKWTMFSLLSVFLLAWSLNTGNEDVNRDQRVKQAVKPVIQHQDTETNLGIAPLKSVVKKKMDPRTKAYREARRAGDIERMRELEARMRSTRVPAGEAAGAPVTPTTRSVGHPGEPPTMSSAAPPSQFSPTDWGTDIHVRGPNTTFRESYPAMATASDGTIFIVWENVGQSGINDYLQLYYSTDGGSSWSSFGYIDNSSYNLSQPSLAVGEGTQDLLVIAYIVDDGSTPHVEVATTPLTSFSTTIVTLPYYAFWESYAKPNVWTDSYEWSSWYIYLTAEAAFDAAANNYNVVFWRSTDFGATYTDPAQVPLGNTDADGWRDPDGTYGTTANNIFIATFNSTDNYLYTLISQDYGNSWSDTVQIREVSPLPSHPVDPDMEAATSFDNVMLTCTKSFSGNDNIGQTYSTDGGYSWTTLFSLEGYTTDNEFAAELTANEGGASWHLAFTSQSWWVLYSTRPQDLSAFWQAQPDTVNDINWASASYSKKAITSNWSSDEAGIAWADYREGAPDYDIFFDRSQPLTLYKGPASGSIAGGASQNTGNFTSLRTGGIDADRVKGKYIPLRETPPASNPPDMVAPLAPEGSNEVDDPAGPEAAPNLIIDFPGIPDDPNSAGYSFIPPDPIGAAGPSHLMACTNTDFAIFDKSGNKLKEIDATLWFENVLPGLDPALVEPFGAAYDPQIVYDHFEDRWVMIYIADNNVDQSYLLLSVSDDSNPLGV